MTPPPSPANSSPSCCHNGMMLLLFCLAPDVSSRVTVHNLWAVCVCERPLPLLPTSANTLQIFHSHWLLFFPAQAACSSPTPRAWGLGGVVEVGGGGPGGVLETTITAAVEGLFFILVPSIYLRLCHVWETSAAPRKNPKNARLPKSNVTTVEVPRAEISCVLCEKN